MGANRTLGRDNVSGSLLLYQHMLQIHSVYKYTSLLLKGLALCGTFSGHILYTVWTADFGRSSEAHSRDILPHINWTLFSTLKTHQRHFALRCRHLFRDHVTGSAFACILFFSMCLFFVFVLLSSCCLISFLLLVFILIFLKVLQ